MNQATLDIALELQQEIATVKQFLADENIVVLSPFDFYLSFPDIHRQIGSSKDAG